MHNSASIHLFVKTSLRHHIPSGIKNKNKVLVSTCNNRSLHETVFLEFKVTVVSFIQWINFDLK